MTLRSILPATSGRLLSAALFATLLKAVAADGASEAADAAWPQFRGPQGNGVARSSRLPLEWEEAKDIRWKTPIHGKAWSSPVSDGSRIWVTTATEDGKQLFVVAVDAETGKILFDKKVFEVEKPQFCHPFNSYASPTPVLEAGRIYVTFGSAGTACVDSKTGEVEWARRDLECNHFRGAGSSPILYGRLLILNYDGSDHQYVVAFDKATGETVWRRERSIDFKDLDPTGKPQVDGDYRKAYATCQVIEHRGQHLLLSQGSKALYAYQPETGEEIWRLEDRGNYSGSTRPLYGNGLIYLPSGFSSGQLLAIRPGRKGEVLDARTADTAEGTELSVAWRTKRGVPKKPSLLLSGPLLFGVEDNGTASCWDALTGEIRWSERVGGHFSASPILAGGRIYYFDEEGKTTVVAAEGTFKRLAENQLGDGFMASPAVIGDALILRSRTHLYRVEQAGAGGSGR